MWVVYRIPLIYQNIYFVCSVVESVDTKLIPTGWKIVHKFKKLMLITTEHALYLGF